MPLTLKPPRIRPWQRVRSDVVGRYRVFDVVEATMKLPDGAHAPHPIYTFTCPDWANVLAFTDDDHAVFVWQYRHGTDRMALEIPGGVIDPGESPIDGARRELREETGYACDSIEPLCVVEPNPAIQSNRHHCFVARGARLTGVTSFDDTEELEVVLVPTRDLAALIDEGHVTHALVINAIERYLRAHT